MYYVAVIAFSHHVSVVMCFIPIKIIIIIIIIIINDKSQSVSYPVRSVGGCSSPCVRP